jgi:hypothetical protein
VGNFTKGWDGSICDEEHIASALEEIGHKVTRWQREQDFSLIEGIENYDFVLLSQWDGYNIEALTKAKKYCNDKSSRTPFVYWAFDYQKWDQQWHQDLIALSDLYLSKRIADSKFDNWQWLSQDFAPAFLNKPSNIIYDKNHKIDHTIIIPKDIDVLFTGTYQDSATERNNTLKAVDDKFNLTIHSVNPEAWKAAGFKNVHGPVMDYDLPVLYQRAKIVISIDSFIEAGFWSDRVAQAMCCGAFVLHRYQPLCNVAFHSYVAYFYDIPSCLKSLEYWLEADEDRENLAERGYEYAQRELKVHNRVMDLLNIVQGVL